jgi:glycosyltransferase involved in cell wall biosynthesis
MPGRVRVALVVDHFPELSETFVAAEAQELARTGHDVHVIAGEHARQPSDAAASGLDVAYLSDDTPRDRALALAWLVLRHPAGCLRDARARDRWRREESPRRLRELAPAAWRLRRRGIGHLHAHFAAGAALDAMRLGVLLRLPTSLMTHGYDIFASPRNLREKHARAAFAMTASDYSLQHLRRLLGPQVGARVDRMVVGVDGDRFRRTTPYPGGRHVVAVARLVEKKGLAHLIDAAALLRDRGQPLERVTIVGHGPLREALAARVAHHGLQDVVRLTGPRPPEAVRELLETASVLAMPCVVAADGDRDTMPVAVKEALAMEVPVVASDEVGLPEVVKPPWGVLCPPGDARALADALEEVLSRPVSERERMGRAGRAHVLEHCSLAKETARLAARIAAASAARPRLVG